MKQAAKILIYISLVFSFWLILPLIFGLDAIKKLDTAKTKAELGSSPILTLLFVNMISGILMLVMTDADLQAN
jgi:fumarate reductase subunit C